LFNARCWVKEYFIVGIIIKNGYACLLEDIPLEGQNLGLSLTYQF